MQIRFVESGQLSLARKHLVHLLASLRELTAGLESQHQFERVGTIFWIDLISRPQQRNGFATFFRMEIELTETMIVFKAPWTLPQNSAQRTLRRLRFVTCRSRRGGWGSLRSNRPQVQSLFGKHLAGSHPSFRSMTTRTGRIGNTSHDEVGPVVKLHRGR